MNAPEGSTLDIANNGSTQNVYPHPRRSSASRDVRSQSVGFLSFIALSIENGADPVQILRGKMGPT
jgi:hypothetical protein